MGSERADVLILGGGFAGLSCAAALADQGAKVLILDKKPHLGGRANSFTDPELGSVDNGQHLLMGCYRSTRRFLRLIGTEDRLDLYKEVAVDYIEPGGKRDRLSCPNWLPAPYHLAVGLLRLKAISWSEKKALLGFDQALKAFRKGPIPSEIEHLTARQWLSSLGLSRNFQARFFDPLVIGALNERPEIASAAGLIQVLREIFSSRESSRFALARVGLSDLYVSAAQKFVEKRGGKIILSAKAASLIEEQGRARGVVSDLGQRYEAKDTVSALPPWELGKLELPPALRGPWETLAPAPIVGATLKVDRPVMAERFLGLLGTETHWVFNKSKIHGLDGNGQLLSVVISGAHDQIRYSPQQILHAAARDLSACLPEFAKARILASKVVKEPFATISPIPGAEAKRPLPGSGIPGFYFAGDWTRTGLPATIESACLSGFAAAQKILGTF